MPKVSVVIPTYNTACFLGEAIQSVLDQTFQDFEIIVVDDGSTDNPKEVVDSFTDSRIKYIYQDNSGVSTAYNRGFKLSRGEYATFLDSDDVLLKGSLEKSLDVMDSHPKVGLSYGQASVMDEDGNIYRVKESGFTNTSGIVDRKKQIGELLFTCLITSSTVVMRSQCLKDVGGFCEELSFGEDRHLYIRLAKRYQVAYIAEPLIKYRMHGDQLHKQVDPKMLERSCFLILHEVFEDRKLAPQFEPLRRQAYSSSYQRIANSAYGNDMKLFRHYIRRAVKAYPQLIPHRSGLSITSKYLASFLPNRLWLGLRRLKWYFMDSTRPELRE